METDGERFDREAEEESLYDEAIKAGKESKSEPKKLPMSVLLAICSEINKSNLAQIRATEMETEVTDQLRLQLLALAAMNSNFEIKAWIKRELEAHSDS